MKAVPFVAAAAAAAAILLAACGRVEGGPAAAGAEAVPADAVVFVAIDGDFDSEQWEDARDLVERFPRGDLLAPFVMRELTDEGLDFHRDVERAVGPEVDFVLLPSPTEDGEPAAALLTQPRDPAALDRLIERSEEELVKDEIGDWTVVAESGEVLDAFRALGDGESLADSGAFKDTMAALEGDAVAKVFVSGETAQEQLAETDFGPVTGVCSVAGELVAAGAALRAGEDGVRVDVTSKEEGGEELETYDAGLVDELPAGAAVYLSFNDFARQFRETRDQLDRQMPEFDEELDEAERSLGVDLEEDILPLLEGEGALAVYTHSLIPTVTLVVEVDDEERAVATVDEIVARFGDARDTEIAGVPAKEVPLEQVSLLYAAFDGKLVLTTTVEGIEGLRDDETKLGDDERFREATEEAGMPDETSGFVYVDADEAVGLVEALAALEGEDIPPDVRENLEPLDAAVLYGSDEDVCFSAFLAID